MACGEIVPELVRGQDQHHAHRVGYPPEYLIQPCKITQLAGGPHVEKAQHSSNEQDRIQFPIAGRDFEPAFEGTDNLLAIGNRKDGNVIERLEPLVHLRICLLAIDQQPSGIRGADACVVSVGVTGAFRFDEENLAHDIAQARLQIVSSRQFGARLRPLDKFSSADFRFIQHGTFLSD